jgi:hypothetical protein
MKQKLNITVFISCMLLYTVVLSSCAENTTLIPSFVPTLSQTPPPTRTNAASATTSITATPILNNKTIIITPDNLFSMPGLKAWSTPDSEDFCEHLPPPQIITNPDRLSLLSGRFVLCIYERVFTAMDLDTGSLVPTDDKRGDIVLASGRFGTIEKPSYVIASWNKTLFSDAYVIEAYANHSGVNKLSYEYCEELVRDVTGRGGMGVEVGAIACVKTTEGQLALLRVEKIYPAKTLSVEFSFAVLSGK